MPDTAPKIRVVVCDDHPIVLSGISNHLRSFPDIEVVAEAVDGKSVLQHTRTLEPDVLVLDINMPGMTAVEVLEALTELPRRPYTLILTAHNDPEYIMALLKAGAKGYLLKDEDPLAITTAVRAVAQGKTWMSPDVMASMIDFTVRDQPKDEQPNLSARELDIMQLLALGRDNQEIGAALNITERTVRYHLRNIYDKLGVQRRGAAIAWAVRQRLGDT